jgi:thiol-disulfide isomerase/thioredoxin
MNEQVYNSELSLQEFRHNIISKFPKSFLAAYFRMMEEPQMPQTIKNNNTEPLKNSFLQKYQYLKQHYFENFDFNDIRLLRTSMIYQKLEYYFNKLLPQSSDTLIESINSLVEKTNKNNEYYKFFVSFFLSNFRAARTHETEKVFVYVADNFYLNGKAPWTDKRFLVLLEKKVSIYRSSLLGCIAPDLAMETIDGKQINLMSIKAQYTLIYFWSPDCNVCQNETEKLHVLYKKMKNNDLEIFAVYVHVDKVIWENYVKEKKLEWINVYDPLLKTDFAKLYNIQSTPELFLLDKDKKIIAKQINVGQLEKILSQKINNP